MSGETKQRLSDLEAENAALRKQLEDRPTLRDQFAMAALAAVIRIKNVQVDKWANGSYKIADAMLEARKNG